MFIFSQYNLFRLNRYSLLINIIINFIWYYCYLLLYVLLFDLLFYYHSPFALENDYKTFNFNFSLYILVLFSSVSLLCLHSFYVSLLLTLYILIVYRTSIIRLVSALANSRSFLLSFLLGQRVTTFRIENKKLEIKFIIIKSLNRTTTILQ